MKELGVTTKPTSSSYLQAAKVGTATQGQQIRLATSVYRARLYRSRLFVIMQSLVTLLSIVVLELQAVTSQACSPIRK